MKIIDRIKKIEQNIRDNDCYYKVVCSDGSIKTVDGIEAIRYALDHVGSNSDAFMITASNINNKDDVDFANLLNAVIGVKPHES